jgi:hypothetical protein
MSSSPPGPPASSVVRHHLSPERIGTYSGACAGDLEKAVRLYRWNASVSAAFWEVLGHGEVILRNAMHNELVAHHQRRSDPGEWFDDTRRVLTQQALDDVRTAKWRAGSGAPPGKVVAGLLAVPASSSLRRGAVADDPTRVPEPAAREAHASHAGGARQ